MPPLRPARRWIEAWVNIGEKVDAEGPEIAESSRKGDFHYRSRTAERNARFISVQDAHAAFWPVCKRTTAIHLEAQAFQAK